MPERAHWFQLVPNNGTIWDMATTERRPRIPGTLAAQIDALRDDIPFEAYIRDILEKHAKAALNRPETMRDYEKARDARRLYTYEDPQSAVVYVDKPKKGGEHDTPGVKALLVVSDDSYGEAIGAYLTEQGLRGMRDVCTELLGEYDGS